MTVKANDDPKNIRGFEMYLGSAMVHANLIQDEHVRKAIKDLVKAIEILAFRVRG